MKKIRKLLKYAVITSFAYLFLCLMTPYNTLLRHRSIENQINYLSDLLDNGYDDALQNRFPEGKQFSNAILALSTIEYFDKKAENGKKYAGIVDACIRRIQSERNLQNFDSNLEPQYGMFFNGWSNLVYSKYQSSTLLQYSELESNVKTAARQIEQELIKIQSDSLRLLDSYDGANWPADNLIGITSLQDDSLKTAWIDKLFAVAQHPSGLIHHAGSQVSIIRGSSSAMITYCLRQTGYPSIEEYNKSFKSIFIDEYLGVQLVKENESGSNTMDVDSGPVVMGYGASATIMNIKTQASLGNASSKSTWALMNTLALPVNLFGTKYYLLKKEPMLDLFMLWGCTAL